MFMRLPLLFEPENTRLIRHLDFELDWQVKLTHEERFPELIQVLVKYLPDLTELKLRINGSGTSTAQYPDDIDNIREPLTKDGQEVARLLRPA